MSVVSCRCPNSTTTTSWQLPRLQGSYGETCVSQLTSFDDAVIVCNDAKSSLMILLNRPMHKYRQHNSASLQIYTLSVQRYFEYQPIGYDNSLTFNCRKIPFPFPFFFPPSFPIFISLSLLGKHPLKRHEYGVGMI